MRKITFLSMFVVLFCCGTLYAQPTNNAPSPTHLASDVISVYGEAYTSVATNYDPNWGQIGHTLVNPNYDPGTGNLVLAYPNFNYQGTDIATQNASGMEFLHIDIWTNNATSVKVSPINNGTGVSEILVDVPLVQGGWSSVDLPKSAFTGMTWDAVFQIKFDGQGGVVPSNIYLDNIYFWKTATPAGSDASLSDLKIDGVTLPGFVSSVTNYTYELVVGTTVAPQITSATTTDSGATVTSITQAAGVPGTASVLVTSQNGNVTKTYTVNFAATFPNPSPTPQTPNLEVLNIYSDTGNFTNNWIPDYNFGTYAGKPDLDLTDGVNEAIKMNFAVAGYGEGTNTVTDISNYQWLHFDYFADSASTQIRFIVIGNNNGAVVEYNYELNTTGGGNGNLVQGSWQSINVPLSFFEGLGFNKANFFQFKLGTLSNLVSQIVYFDNIYFSVNEPLMSAPEFGKTAFSAYPNPAHSAWNVSATSEITSVALVDVSGKIIREMQPNSLEASIDASGLANGIYFAKVMTANASKTIKLVKN